MKTLLHICCAPCSVSCIDLLKGEGIDITGYWYNPNIHPFTEYKNRKNTLIDFAKSIDLDLVVQNDYGLRKFISGIYPDFDNRCEYCYTVRLNEAAKYASENGFDNFTTTLLISPYQKHDVIREVAKKAAKEYNIDFLYRDFRDLFRVGQQKARDLGLYMQKYCGCVFSEEERYSKLYKKPKKES